MADGISLHAGQGKCRRRSASLSQSPQPHTAAELRRLRSQSLGNEPPFDSPSAERVTRSGEGTPFHRGRHSIVDVHPTLERLRGGDYGSIAGDAGINEDAANLKHNIRRGVLSQAKQIPAITLIGMFHLMIGIPFGVSYFPIGWRPDASESGISGGDDDSVNGTFPLPGKEALGIRMFLFSTTIGQIILTFASKFNNAIGLQMVENVPFCHSLAAIVIAEQGYGIEALSTLFFLFGLASVVVGAVFYILGRLELGRVVYFFPSHVLVGLIGGIGVFIAKTGIEVTIDSEVSFDTDGIRNLVVNMDLLSVVLFFEVVLRVLQHVTKKDGKAGYPLLSPIYFCMITPVFYLSLWIFRVDIAEAEVAGYFFPSLDACDTEGTDNCNLGVFNEDLWVMFRIVDLSTVSWKAIWKAIPTVISLAMFSLIHVPINIPAFAISTNVEADMNAELIAHGYSNAIAGVFGGLQNYLAYTQSVLYAKSGGSGKASSIAVAIVTSFLFVIGPTIGSYIPRSMAGTLLLHVGIDLFLEGLYDSFSKFDVVEYVGIVSIVAVMTFYGMEAAMIAGVIAALSTYVTQSITYLNPIRGCMSAATLTSSAWSRRPAAVDILNDENTGRGRVFVIQLQGSLFFGNAVLLADSIKRLLSEKQGTNEEPLIVIMDFSLVVGLDSSAAQAITKLKRVIHTTFHVVVCVFVTGSDEGFPCNFDLTRELSAPDLSALDEDELGKHSGPANLAKDKEGGTDVEDEATALLQVPCRSESGSHQSLLLLLQDSDSATEGALKVPHNHVVKSLDEALMFAEDVLLSLVNPDLLNSDEIDVALPLFDDDSLLPGERENALRYLVDLCPGQDITEVRELFSLFDRQVYVKDEILWRQGSQSDCLKLLVRGKLVSMLEHEAGTSETISVGCVIGEFGLVNGAHRMSTVKCSEDAIVYNLSRESWEKLIRENPQIARYVDLIVIRYLAHRVQHVSNRIFETRCLPI